MQKTYTILLDDDTIRKLNVLSKLKFSKERKASSFIRDLIEELYNGAVLVARNENGSASAAIFGGEEFPCYSRLDMVDLSASKVCICADFTNRVTIESFDVSFFPKQPELK